MLLLLYFYAYIMYYVTFGVAMLLLPPFGHFSSSSFTVSLTQIHKNTQLLSDVTAVLQILTLALTTVFLINQAFNIKLTKCMDPEIRIR